MENSLFLNNIVMNAFTSKAPNRLPEVDDPKSCLISESLEFISLIIMEQLLVCCNNYSF